MKKCEHFGKCIDFFREQAKKFPTTTSFIEATFSKAVDYRCARIVVFMTEGSENLPIDLFPCQYVKGEKIGTV